MKPFDTQLLAMLGAIAALTDHTSECPEEKCIVRSMLTNASIAASAKCAIKQGIDVTRLLERESTQGDTALYLRECIERVAAATADPEMTLVGTVAAAEVATTMLVEQLRHLDPDVAALRN